MRKIIVLLLIILLPALLVAQVNGAAQPVPLVFKHLTVIDMTGARPMPDMTVIIRSNRITVIGKSSKVRIPKGAQVIDATGRFLIPGLWDMHVHLGNGDFDKNSNLRLFIANGITGIRIMEGAPEYHLWRREIEGGKLPGPRMSIASRIIDGPKSFLSDAVKVSNEAEARKAVREARQEGADFVKVYDNLSRNAYFALVNEAMRLGLPVEGHVPSSITAEEASDAGQKSIEHLTGLDEAKSDDRKAEALIAVFKRNKTWQCPTINMRNNYASLDDARLAEDPRLKYVKPSWKKRWLNMTKEARGLPSDEWSKRKELIRKEKALIGKMQKMGVLFLAGTDDANPYSFVGFSLHDELALLVDAGLTPMEALQTATLNPAKFLNRLGSLGTVEKGKLADLVLLDSNPLENIRNIQHISAVIVNGRYFSREALQQILAGVEAAASKS